MRERVVRATCMVILGLSALLIGAYFKQLLDQKGPPPCRDYAVDASLQYWVSCDPGYTLDAGAIGSVVVCRCVTP